jgi:hypothetical protein
MDTVAVEGEAALLNVNQHSDHVPRAEGGAAVAVCAGRRNLWALELHAVHEDVPGVLAPHDRLRGMGASAGACWAAPGGGEDAEGEGDGEGDSQVRGEGRGVSD